MSLNTQGLAEDLDVDVLTNLWTAAPFPYLPSDAPVDIKQLTIDIADPARIYTIHRASRRHHLHALIEKFITQIRYGCQNELCTTSTCFSCRKRLAAGAPVRRYNTTSARTLAVYLASLDDPEQGLCQITSAERVPPALVKDANHVDRKSLRISTRDTSRRKSSQRRNGYTTLHANTTASKTRSGDERSGQTESRSEHSAVSILDEPVRTDHKSFVQNMFGTVALKMLQWLTPRSLDILARSDTGPSGTGAGTSDDSYSSPTPPQDFEETLQTPPKIFEEDKMVSDLATDPFSEADRSKHSDNQETEVQKSPQPILTLGGEPKVNGSADPRAVPTSFPHLLNFPSRKKSDIENSKLSKGILDISPVKSTDNMSERRPLSVKPPQRRLSQRSLVTSPKSEVNDASSYTGGKQLPPSAHSAESSPQVLKISEIPADDSMTPKVRVQEQRDPETTSAKRTVTSQPLKDSTLPQSLSRLSIEVIDLICDILHTDDTYEKGFIHPEVIHQGLKRFRKDAVILRRIPLSTQSQAYPPSLRLQWHLFIEQGIFDVLSNSEPLLQSFSSEKSMLYDSQTIWYLALRMTRVCPSLVFHSLWNVVGTLFHPPPNIYRHPRDSPSQVGVSNVVAAQVIKICLHFLVAAVPLVADARQLANISRIRSYGLTTIGRGQSSTGEQANLYLHYDDAFTNDLTLRLARRVFAVIPTRRGFAELLELQQEVPNQETETDLLQMIISTLDLGLPLVIDFPADERELHEKRMPTLILDWARTIMLHDWAGTAEVPSDGTFGGALAMVAAIYKNRKTLLLGDIHFRTEYFAQRLDSIEMPLEWLSFESNRKTVHLLDYPYLFDASTLITYFRAINYSRMNQAYETAKAANDHIRNTIDAIHLMPDRGRQSRLYNRLNIATAKYMVLEIRRNNVLQDTFNSIWRREERELMRPLKIRLGQNDGEEGLDFGGVQQEFFRLAIAEALNPDCGTFTVDTRTRMTWFRPASPEPLWKFELIGMIVSLAVYNGLTLPITFPKALYRKLLGEEVTELHHIADGWPDLASGLTTLLEWDESQGLIGEVFSRTYEFSVDQFGKYVSRDMMRATDWPQFSDTNISPNPADAPLVTNENRNSYVSDYIHWLTDVSVRPQFDAFQAGFFAVVDRRSVALFDPDILQSVVEGIQEIDITELRRYTLYEGWDTSHDCVKNFWSIVKRYDHDQKRKLLEFTTASDRVPVGGMANLIFKIQKNGTGDALLPTSSTCFGTLCLPAYTTKEVMKERLEVALANSQGFGNH